MLAAPRRARHPGRAELSGTAALLELARIYRQRELRKTLVLVSTSGATTGFAGARAWAREAAAGRSASPIDAVLVLGDMAGDAHPQAVGRAVVERRLARAARRSSARSSRPCAREVAPRPGRPARPRPVGPPRAAAHGLRQGAIADAGLPAVLLSARPASSARRPTSPSSAAPGAFGRAALRAVTAIDEAGPVDPDRAARSPAFAAGPEGIVTMRNVLPDWAVRLLVGTLLLPALLAALDGFFRARRRRLRAGRWAAWVGACALRAAAGVAVAARCSGVTGALAVPATPVAAGRCTRSARPGSSRSPRRRSSLAVGWFGVRPLLVARARARRGSPAAGGAAPPPPG